MPKISVQQFKREIRSCILLRPDIKKFWMEKAETVPYPLLRDMYKTVKAKNRLIKKYIQKALKEDKKNKILKELDSQIAEIKTKAKKLEEVQEQKEAEKLLEEL